MHFHDYHYLWPLTCAVLARCGAARFAGEQSTRGRPDASRISLGRTVGLAECEDRGRQRRRHPGRTAAIQSVLNKFQPGTTVYFPPGTYRITKTLESPTGRYLGVTLIGHGRTTTLAWDGEAGGRMFWSHDGMLTTRYVGLTWDGRGKAAVGFDHSCVSVFETEIRHQYEAYLNFTESGIRVGKDQHIATAETIYDSCLFEKCAHGITIHTFNDLDHTILGCEFRHCGVGIYAGKGSNFYARDCHFAQSTDADIRVSTTNPPAPSVAAPRRVRHALSTSRAGSPR